MCTVLEMSTKTPPSTTPLTTTPPTTTAIPLCELPGRIREIRIKKEERFPKMFKVMIVVCGAYRDLKYGRGQLSWEWENINNV